MLKRELEAKDYENSKGIQNGRSQAVRLPKECRFTDDEVLFLSGLNMFSANFMVDGREDQTEQERDSL